MIPTEILEFFQGEIGKVLLVKGNPGTGKTIFALTLLNEICDLNNGIYLSTRMDSEKLYEDFPWIKDAIPEENIIDATQSEFTSLGIPDDEQGIDRFINVLNNPLPNSPINKLSHTYP
ncbi:MAG: gas vesicle protein GvpD P-loop domain-containing protein [Candidatus Syntropharchaeia archaeon]